MQLAFMRALWKLGEASVAEVQAELDVQGQVLATTTVATVLRRLESAKYVSHRRDGRQFVYRARVTQQALGSRALERLSASIYGGDVGALLTQLVGSLSVKPDDLAEIQRLIDAKTEERKK